MQGGGRWKGAERGRAAARGGKGSGEGAASQAERERLRRGPPVCTIFYQFNSCIFAEAQREQKCRGREKGEYEVRPGREWGGRGSTYHPGSGGPRLLLLLLLLLLSATTTEAALRMEDGNCSCCR